MSVVCLSGRSQGLVNQASETVILSSCCRQTADSAREVLGCVDFAPILHALVSVATFHNLSSRHTSHQCC